MLGPFPGAALGMTNVRQLNGSRYRYLPCLNVRYKKTRKNIHIKHFFRSGLVPAYVFGAAWDLALPRSVTRMMGVIMFY